MEFLVRTEVCFPTDVPPPARDDLIASERERAIELMETRSIRRMWRIPGVTGSLAVYEAQDANELDALLEALPLRRYLSIEVTTLANHPVEDAVSEKTAELGLAPELTIAAAPANSAASQITQVAAVTPALERTLDELVRVGIGPFRLYELGRHNARALELRGEPVVYSARFAFASCSGLQLEVIQPTGGPSIFQEFLDSGGQGLHHVALASSDAPFDKRRWALEAAGFSCVQSGQMFDGAVRFAYFAGCPGTPLIEIAERSDGFSISAHAIGSFPPQG